MENLRLLRDYLPAKEFGGFGRGGFGDSGDALNNAFKLNVLAQDFFDRFLNNSPGSDFLQPALVKSKSFLEFYNKLSVIDLERISFVQ